MRKLTVGATCAVIASVMTFGVTEAIRAQAKPPGYLVALVTVKDETAANEYREKFLATLPAHGGKYLIRGGQMAPLYNSEGAQRIVVVQFPSFDKAKEWGADPKVVQLRPLRDKAQSVRGALVEGVE
jgi:uncharacterized protein (DUF1330 family)